MTGRNLYSPILLLSLPWAIYGQQNRAAHVLRMLPHINQRRLRSIRPPQKINPVITEPGADIIEIIHRDGRCVFRQVRALLERVTQLPDVIDWKHLAQVILRCSLSRN